MCTVYAISPDTGILDGLETFLESFGIPVRFFTTAESFLSTFVDAPAGCVIAETDLPGLNGLELTIQLRESGSTLPVLLLAGMPTPAYAQLAIEAGANGVLEKPFINNAIISFLQLNCRPGCGELVPLAPE